MHNAVFVVAGMLLSRLAGLLRARAFAHYFGVQSDAADAFNAAFRIPNVLQNLFGEGALSASFIPVYAGLVARGERRDADLVAGAVGGLLALVVAAIALAGVLFAAALTSVVAPGFEGARRELTITLVRILFPGAALLVLSAWCLAILNSHGRFLLSYAAPVMWNAAMIVTLVAFGPRESLPRLAVLLAWGSVVGSALQLAVQVPSVVRAAPQLGLGRLGPHVRGVVRNFVPAFISRGVVQISAFVDALLASLLPTGAMTGLANAQLIYTLPVSLFGMSVAAAELPVMSGVAAADATSAGEDLRARINRSLRRVAYFVVPSATACVALGDTIASTLFETGRFGRSDAVYVWAILAGAAVGLLPSTLGRLYASAYYAVRDTRTPLRYALLRVTLGTALGYALAIHFPPAVGWPPAWGAAGITLGSGIGSWLEMWLLRRTLWRRLGQVGLPASLLTRLWGTAVAAGGAAWAVKTVLPPAHPVVAGTIVLGVFGLAYLGGTMALGVPEGRVLLSGRSAGFRPRGM